MKALADILLQHILGIAGVATALGALVQKLDAVVVFLLRFVSPEIIKAELDRLNALAKAEVDKDAKGPIAHS